MQEIEWKLFGNLRDVYLYGYYKSEFNDPPLIYAMFIKKDILKRSIKELWKIYDELKDSNVAWKQKDAEILKNTLKGRNLTLEILDELRGSQILVYIGKTKQKIANRFIESFDPGSSIPVYLLNIPASEIKVYISNLKNSRNPEDYDNLESFLIEKYDPLLNKDRKTPSKEVKYVETGNFPLNSIN